MNRKDDGAFVPDLILERYRLGELPPDEKERLERRLAEDLVLRARLDALEISDSDIHKSYPPEWLARQIQNRLGAPSPESPGLRTWPRLWPVAGALATIVILAITLTTQVFHLPPDKSKNAPANVPADRIKGLQPALALFLKTESGAGTLADGDIVHAGDLIRIGYRALGQPYGVILSIDGHGAVTLHLPRSGGRAASLKSGSIVLLNEAYELDDAPRFERFFFVTSHQPFEAALVVAAAGNLAEKSGSPPAALPLPEEFMQSSFTIKKGARP